MQQLGDRGFPNPPERKDFTVHNLEQHASPPGLPKGCPGVLQVIVAT